MKTLKTSKIVLIALVILGILGISLFLGANTAQANSHTTLIKTADNPAVYFVSERLQAKKAILSGKVFFSYPNHSFSQVKTVSQAKLDSYRDIKLVKAQYNPGVYYIDGATKRLIPSEDVFNALGFVWSDILQINKIDLNSYKTGTPMKINMISTANVPNTKGQLAVSIVNKPTTAGSIPSGVWHNFTELKLDSKNGKTVVIKGLTISFSGLNMGNEASDIYLTDEAGNQIGKLASIKDRQARFNMFSDPIVIASGESKTIKIYANIKTGGVTIGFGIGNPADINTTSAVAGNFPMNGYEYKIIDGGQFVAGVSVNSLRVSNTARAVRVGVKNQVITKFQFTETSDTQDVLIRKIVLTKKGNLNDYNLANIDLVNGRKVLLTAPSIENGKIIFDFGNSPLILERGKSATFTVRGDFIGGSDEKIQLVIENFSDIILEGKEYGLRILPSATLPIGAGNSEDYNAIKIAEGEATAYITAQKTNQDVVVGATDVSLGKFTIKADGSALNFNGFNLKINRNGETDLDGDIVIKNGDTVLAKYKARDYIGQSRELSFDHDVTISNGQSFTFEVLGDIDDEANNADSYSVTLNNFDLYTTIDHDEIGGDWEMTGHTIGVKVSEANITVNPKYCEIGIIAGQGKQLVGSFVIQVGSAEDLILNSATIENQIADELSIYNGYENIYLAINRKTIATIASPIATTHIFDFDDYKFKKGKSYTIDIYVDTTDQADGSELKIRLTDLILTGVVSGVAPQVNGLGLSAQAVVVKASRLNITTQAIESQVMADTKDTIIGRFTITNDSMERINVDELYLYETPDSDTLSADGGFSNLRLVLSDNWRKRVGKSVRSPLAGGNKLGGFYLNPGVSIHVNVLVDTNDVATNKTINLMIKDISAIGKTSKTPVEIVSDSLILGSVSFK